MKKLILYEKFPSRVINNFGVVDVSEPTVRISSFEVSSKGLTAAIKEASRPDAQVLVISEIFHSGVEFKAAIEKLVKQKKSKSLFKPLTLQETV